MFYQLEYLKRGGRFYLCWVADSWPLRFATITQRQLRSQDICKISDSLLKMITSESGSPMNRFSLRLSSRLTHGLVRIYERKATILLSNCCTFNADVMKSINKKWNVTEKPEVGQSKKKTQQQRENVPQVIITEVPGPEENVEEMLRNSRNVANIQDITLKESAMPEHTKAAADGFGEEDPNVTVMLAADRTVEVMLHTESFAQHSGLDQLLDVTGKSHDRSRLQPHEPQMERITEHDLTMLGKEIPDLPEIPPPDVPIPEPEKLVQK